MSSLKSLNWRENILESHPVDVREKDIAEVLGRATEGWGADIVFEASGNPRAVQGVFSSLCPGGCVVFIGIPTRRSPLDIVVAQVKEARLKASSATPMFSRGRWPSWAVNIDVKPLITDLRFRSPSPRSTSPPRCRRKASRCRSSFQPDCQRVAGNSTRPTDSVATVQTVVIWARDDRKGKTSCTMRERSG